MNLYGGVRTVRLFRCKLSRWIAFAGSDAIQTN